MLDRLQGGEVIIGEAAGAGEAGETLGEGGAVDLERGNGASGGGVDHAQGGGRVRCDVQPDAPRD